MSVCCLLDRPSPDSSMSPSVEELRARIVDLDSEIDLQKKLLKKLEKDRSLAQRHLNAVLDPMSRLPPEISSEIFLQSLPASPSGMQGALTALLKVCSAWTDIALATPVLWTTVHIDFPCDDALAEVLPIWFGRARHRPLTIFISLRGRCFNWNHRVSDVLWRHGGQVKHLEIFDDDDFATRDEDDQTIDLFGENTPVSLPLLETLMIRCQHQHRNYLAPQILELVRRAPNIVESTFNMATVNAFNDGDPKMVEVPTLRRVMFEDIGHDDILQYLSLPALETLSVPLSTIMDGDFLAFLERSGASLRDLTLGSSFRDMDSLDLYEYLRSVPKLTKFTMWLPGSDVVTELFAAFADYSLLPSLDDLTIYLNHEGNLHISDSSWRTLVRVLSSRGMEQLYITPILVSLPMDVLDSLRELTIDGANIWIGTEERNFVGA
ncbi:F-box domain-containing protein [Mycena sanguinolenta]|uniref:F-box domain-containing protein n=1 Tax=Mycena sanguinolenta TaxID=230812 RepID=A0A8H6ZD56_9AGAR|nr:F-box domain-containing protein [Mycena sanguinolenta]